VLTPVYVVLITSFKTSGDTTAASQWSLPKEWTLEPWRKAWDVLQPYMIRSLSLAIPAAIISSLIGSANGFVLARWRFPKSGGYIATEQFVQEKLIGLGSTRFPRHAVDVFRAGLLPLPAPLMLQRQNLRGGQLRVERADNFAGLPILIVTGNADLEHPRDADGTTAEWLAGLGADVEYRFLADAGITGNGHMLMFEDNSREIALSIAGWLEKTGIPSSTGRR